MGPWLSPLAALFLLVVAGGVQADPATIPFTDCFSASNGNLSQRINIDTVYAQVLPDSTFGTYLNLTLLGSTPQEVLGFTNESSSLATLFTFTSVLTLNAFQNSSYLCQTLRPPSPLSPLDPDKTYCPIPVGPLALSATVPLGSNRALTTLDTRIRAVDPFSNELLCIDLSTTPLQPKGTHPYGSATIILWSTVALAIVYWLIVGVARIVSAWGRGLARSEKGLWSRAQSAGFILASAISGERLATSPALMRFCTPSMRDIIFHTQWCAALAMVAVEWPNFVYPLLSQTAWSTLIYNITLTSPANSSQWNPLSTLPYDPPANFAPQLSDPTSPLYIVPDVPNALFMLPPNVTTGLSAFSYTVGIHPSNLFGVCMILFLGINAATIAISTLIWLMDYIICVFFRVVGKESATPPGHNPLSRITGTRAVGGFKESSQESSTAPMTAGEDYKESSGGHVNTLNSTLYRPTSKLTIPFSTGHGSHLGAGTLMTSDRAIHSHRAWWRIRVDMNSFHGSVLQGNLVRILVLFHLPVTIFSCFHMTLPHSAGGTTSGKALAGLSFAFFSLLIPAHLVLRMRFTTTNKLYDETRTLLALGPLYNHYRHGSQMFASLLFATNLIFGVTIGAGQSSGTAQAILILVVEVVSALVTSIWLPWGSGASMGLISFLFCVARIVIAVLLVILTPAISIGSGAGGWVAYGILVILALVYLALSLMLLVKVMEALVRISGGIGFDRSRHTVDSGLLGACGLLGCCGPRRKRDSPKHKYRHADDNISHHTHSSLAGIRPPRRESDGSYTPAGTATPPRFLGQVDSRKGSTHSGPPPSVLKPEHALRPYREDTDDENGFIMGAWQPFSRPGYQPVAEPQSPQQPPPPKSGFSRIGGGKAHIDTPYAIAAGSTQTFRSGLPQQSNAPAVAAPVFYDDDDESPPPSVSNASTLPPGAMQPHTLHVRTKSQSAIIENPAAFAQLNTSSNFSSQPGPSGTVNSGSRVRQASGGLSQLTPPHVMVTNDDDEDSDDQTQPKKKHWYQFGRRRAHSSEGMASSSNLPAAPFASTGSAEPEPNHTPTPARSFVVIRKGQSQGSRMASSSSGPPEDSRPADSSMS